MDAITEAEAIAKMLKESGWSGADYARSMGLSRSAVSHKLRLLELAPQIQTMVRAGQLAEGHARVLLRLDQNKQTQVAAMVVKKKLSVRALEKLLAENKVYEEETPDIKAIKNDLIDYLHTMVQLEYDTHNKHVEFQATFHSLDAFEGFLDDIGFSRWLTTKNK